MKYIIVDLEATCWNGKREAPSEIIEIGAVCINDQKETVGEFNIFIKPSLAPKLSEFCTELTSITQEMINDASLYPEALQEFLKWIEDFEDDFWLCSWGFYDKNQFTHDCKLHGLNKDWLGQHISIKHQYHKIKPTRRPMGMKGALKLEGFELDGTHHRGIDDARNIAKIFLAHFDHWTFDK